MTLASALLLFLASASPDLVVNLGFSNAIRVEPATSSTAMVSVSNTVAATATNVVLTVTAPEGGTLDSARIEFGSADCSAASNTVVCTRASLGLNDGFVIDIGFTAPDRLSGGAFALQADVRADEADAKPADNARSLAVPVVRHLVVTNTADEGSGSLRQALLDANAFCENDPCAIDFRIPGPSGVLTISPLTALPPVRGKVVLDGGTQTAFRAGTSIEINGALQDEADGLRVGSGCRVQIFRLTVDGFRGYGITVHQEPIAFNDVCGGDFTYPPVTIAHNTIGRNYRGVVSEGSSLTIDDNVIGGNQRSGVFIWTGFYAAITHNRIIGNGASGIYLNIGGPEYGELPDGADVVGNTITDNAEFGIARSRNGEISVIENSIYQNGHGALDVDLDLATPNRSDDRVGIPNKPELFSAVYDAAANATIVRGVLDSSPGSTGHLRIDFYASRNLSRVTAQPEGETLVQKYDVTSAAPVQFEVSIPGNLRGRWITATNNRTHIVGFAKVPGPETHPFDIPSDTSEFSNPVRVP